MNKSTCSPGSFLTGLVAGALVGAGIALLYAPQSGEETRKQLKKKADEVKDKAEKAKEDALVKMEEMKETAQQKAADIKKRAKKAAKEFKGEKEGSKA